MKSGLRAHIYLFLLIVLVTACTEKAPAVTIESAEAVPSPVLIGVASVFMKISNTGGGADAITEARVDIPGSIAELHDIVDGKMVKVDEISIPADSTVFLRPARQHIMLLRLPKSMKKSSPISMIVRFKRSGERIIPLELTKPASSLHHN